MIIFKTGSIFAENAEALINPVNCVGVMGKGLALQFKNKFPQNFIVYLEACKKRKLRPGQVLVVKTNTKMPKYIINFPTKRHWREGSRLEDIEDGLKALAFEIESLSIQSIAIPALGCGLGGLNWGLVKAKIEDALKSLDAEIIVLEPTSFSD